MAIDFPNSPAVNDTFTSGNITRKWDGTTWSIIATTITGPTGATGPQILSATSPIVWDSANRILSFATSPTITTPTIATINAGGTTATASLFPDVTVSTGSIAIGAGLTTGALNIATAGTGATPISIGHTNATIGLTGNTTVTGTLTTTSTINKVTITAPVTSATLTLVTGSSLITAGAFALTLTSTATTNATFPAGTTTLAANVTTTIGDVIYASATGTPGTLARLAGNTATQPSFLSSTGNGTANTTTAFTTSTGSGSVVLGTSPTIATPQLSLETTSRTTEGSMSWDSTYDFLRIGNATVAKSFFPFDINTTAKTAAYTLTTSDFNTLVQMNGAFAFTVGTGLSAAPVGTQIHLFALTAGVSVTAVSTTIYSTPGLKLRAQYSMATLICIASNVWILTGDLSA